MDWIMDWNMNSILDLYFSYQDKPRQGEARNILQQPTAPFQVPAELALLVSLFGSKEECPWPFRHFGQ